MRTRAVGAAESRRRFAVAAVLFAVLLAAGCSTLPPDLVAESGGEKEKMALEDAELRLLELRISPDQTKLAALRAELASYAERPGISRLMQARVESLRAEAALAAGDKGSAMAFANAAAELSPAEDGLWLVRAALSDSPAARLVVLDKGLAAADRKGRILCERGAAFLAAGRYAEAAQDLDEGLRSLDQRYRDLYGSTRDQAFAMAGASRQTGSTQPLQSAPDLQAPITVRTMVELALKETRFLQSLGQSARPTADSLLPALKDAGLLLAPDSPLDGQVSRSQAAFFLWGIVARNEHNPALLQVYREKYTSTPVADVPVDAPCFDAVLGCVERELMELPDGIHFNPDGVVTGFEYLAMLGKLKSEYR